MTINFADILRQDMLPSDGVDYCSKVNLVVVGEDHVSDSSIVASEQALLFLDSAGLVVDAGTDDDKAFKYIPAPYVVEAEHADHANHRREKVFSVDPDVDVFFLGSDIVSDFNYTWDTNLADTGTNPLIDEERSSFLQKSGGGDTFIMTESDSPYIHRVVGVKICYRAYIADTIVPNALKLTLIHMSDIFNLTAFGSDPNFGISSSLIAASDFAASRSVYALPSTESPTGVIEHFIFFPNHAFQSREYIEEVGGITKPFFRAVIETDLDQFSANEDFKFITLLPLCVNQDKVLPIAESYLRIPSPRPQRIKLAGRVSPDLTVTIPDYPGGSQTWEVQQVIYQDGFTYFELGTISDRTKKLLRDGRRKERNRNSQKLSHKRPTHI
jgi:hypothetical protein